uniref:Cupin type-1 domain-containing protein n=1 Tax=Psilocybe cubensis TaxID=181762 RepID=A0A8H7XWS0_PSICU
MRLKLYDREMHWHSTSEWAYVLKGDLRVSTITPEGQVWVGDVSAGDLWYFPAGNPHSIQAKDTAPDGAEFLLIFDSGSFSEDSTFQLTDWLAHVPKSVIAKNFGMTGNLDAFDHIPEHELYIFPSLPPSPDISQDMVIPNNTPHPYTYQFSKVVPEQKEAGTVKVVDSRTFTVSETIAAAEVELEVGGLRELHVRILKFGLYFMLHVTDDIFSNRIVASNAAGMDLLCVSHHIIRFSPGTKLLGLVLVKLGSLFSRPKEMLQHTISMQGGDIAYIPPTFGHYIENIGNTTLKFVEILKSDIFQDISLSQWLALTPPNLVKAHLGFSDEVMAKLTKTKKTLVK